MSPSSPPPPPEGDIEEAEIPFLSDLVLVVDDDPLVGQHIVRHLGGQGCPAVHIDDYDLAKVVTRSSPPAVIVVDQIIEDDDGDEFLRWLTGLQQIAPKVVLIRYEGAPVRSYGGLDMTVVAGEDWFEQLLGTMEPAEPE